MRIVRTAVLAAVLLALLAACDKTGRPAESDGTPPPAAQTASAPPAQTAPADAAIPAGWTGDAINFSYTTAAGETRTADSYAGKPLVLNFWAAW